MKALSLNLFLILSLAILFSCGGGKSGSGNSSMSSSLTSPYKYYVYVANYSDSTISSFSMNRETGILTSIETTASEGNPISLAVSPSGDKLYVAKANSASLQIFSINKTNGALIPFQTISTNNSTQSSVTASSDGRFVYLTSYSGIGNIYSVSGLTGNLIPLKNIDSTASKAIIYPNSNLMLLSSTSGITFWPINKITGDVLIAGGAYTALIAQPHTLVLSNEKMYVSYNYQGYGMINSYSIDELNRTASPIQLGLASGSSIGGIAISNLGKILVATEPNAKKIHSYLINSITGILSKVDSMMIENSPNHVTFVPDGMYALLLDGTQIFTLSVDENSGKFQKISDKKTGLNPVDIIIVKSDI